MDRHINRDDLILVYPDFRSFNGLQKFLAEQGARNHLNRAGPEHRARTRRAFRDASCGKTKPVF
ncbi:MAG: hypothetical protein EHM49_04205 [Deltaproteobacteria bacterium]|nr:MAG: hypothetical protein EHM49_04205 [Deltaproteobacteria bacterium]